MTKLSPLALSNLIRHAFIAGYAEGSPNANNWEASAKSWTEYEPPEPLFERVHDALYPQTGEAIRARSTAVDDATSLLTEYVSEWADRQHILAMNDGLVDDSPFSQARDAKIEELKGRILALMGGG